MEKAKNIAIFGGAFNPIHKGHINLINEFDKIFRFDKILLIPTKTPPHKSKDEFVSDEHRMNMLKLVNKDYPKLTPCDIELNMEGVSYTVNTLTKLQIKYPDVNFYLIIGSDMLRIFDKWYRYQDILKIATVLSGAREQNELHELEQFAKTLDKTGQKIKVVIHDVLPMSSTMVRKAIKNNSDATQFLLPQIYEYIKQNKLYE